MQYYNKKEIVIFFKCDIELIAYSSTKINFFCKWSDSEYFQHCSPYSLLHRYSVIVGRKELYTIHKQVGLVVFQ